MNFRGAGSARTASEFHPAQLCALIHLPLASPHLYRTVWSLHSQPHHHKVKDQAATEIEPWLTVRAPPCAICQVTPKYR